MAREFYPQPKPIPRVIAKVWKTRDLAKLERDCRAEVRRRDHGKCQRPGCKASAVHCHHIKFRSRGGRWVSSNIVSLCVDCHKLVHARLITISGDANVHLDFHGSAELLRFGL